MNLQKELLKRLSAIDGDTSPVASLPRVLAALPDGYKLTNFKATNLAGGYWVQICDRWGEDDEICCWLLTKIGLKSSRDATADDQSEETLQALIDLFPKNDN